MLIDAGAGALLGGKSSGRLVANLKASGYRPEQIDAVLITHIHGDHSAGLTVDGKPVFPEATVHVHARERDYWLSSTEADRAPEKKKASFAQAHTALDPYIEKGRLKTFDGEAELYPGIRTWPHPGHTPGHTYYVVESKDQKLVLLGDTVHATQVQFPRPDIAMRFDFDSAAAADQRQRIFADAAEKGYWLGAAAHHFSGARPHPSRRPGMRIDPGDVSTHRLSSPQDGSGTRAAFAEGSVPSTRSRESAAPHVRAR